MYILGLTTLGDSAASLIKDGELIAAAEADGFDVLLTTDRNLNISRTWLDAKLRSWFYYRPAGRVFKNLPQE